jgi:ribosomal protein S18 acetylase RimI-like enzyme
MRYYLVDSIDEDALNHAARLHYESLSYRSFITSFGPRLLREIYHDLLKYKLGFLVFAEQENKIQGFVLGCKDTSRLFQMIRKHFLKYFGIIFSPLLRKPSSIKKILETLLYPGKEQCDLNAELIVIAVDLNARAQGIGTELVLQMEKEFTKMHIDQYKVTVHEEMTKSNNFYLKNGFKLNRRFIMYNIPWNLYTKKITAI